jgi:hypothetical protein
VRRRVNGSWVVHEGALRKKPLSSCTGAMSRGRGSFRVREVRRVFEPVAAAAACQLQSVSRGYPERLLFATVPPTSQVRTNGCLGMSQTTLLPYLPTIVVTWMVNSQANSAYRAGNSMSAWAQQIETTRSIRDRCISHLYTCSETDGKLSVFTRCIKAARWLPLLRKPSFPLYTHNRHSHHGRLQDDCPYYRVLLQQSLFLDLSSAIQL